MFLKGTDLAIPYHWLYGESKKSSTWKEIQAIELCLESFSFMLQNSSVTFYTDIQNDVSIDKKGSKIHDLQLLTLSVYSICVNLISP